MNNVTNASAYRDAVRAKLGLAPRDAFAAWLRDVDRQLVILCGLDSGSLEDWDWYGDFRARLNPSDAVREWRIEVLRNYGVGSHD